MRNGVYFRLSLTIPRRAVPKWRAAKLGDQRARCTVSDAHDGSAILGGELLVEARTLSSALATMTEMGLELPRKDIAGWAKVRHEGKAHIRIETKGAVPRDATVEVLLDWLAKQTRSGREFIQVESDGKNGKIDLWGYLSGWDAYSDHHLPLLMLGVAGLELGGEGELVFMGDVDLTDEPVCVHAKFRAGEFEIEEWDPQDLSEDEAEAMAAALGEGGWERITTAHQAWLSGFRTKQLRRQRAGCVGWLRPDGSFAIEPRFRSAQVFSGGLAAVSEHGPFDYGYIDERGELVVEPRYFTANPHKEGLACVQLETSRTQTSEWSWTTTYAHGYIDRHGEVVIPFEFEHAEDFSEERAIVGDLEKRGYIDRSGKLITEVRYQTAKPYAEGLALVAEHDEYETGGYGFLDRAGKVAIPLALEQSGWFIEGLAPASRGGRWGFIDPRGEWAIPPRYEASGYMMGERTVIVLDGKAGVIDRRGELVVPCEYERIVMLGQWFKGETEGERVRVHARTGELLFETDWEVIEEPRDGLMIIARSYAGPFGYMDERGRVVIEPRFGFAAPFSDGLAIVEDGGVWGIIDRSGKMLVRLGIRLRPSAGAGPFARNGLAWIEDLGSFGLVTREGKIVHPPEAETILGYGEDLIWIKYPDDHDS
jgi:hypothetical protein